MFIEFFYILRAHKIPVGTQEWLMLMEALLQNLADCSLDRFYTLARSILVKSESLYDAYDQAFIFCFKGISEKKEEWKSELLEWLNRVVDPQQRPTLPPEAKKLDLEELRRQFLERLKEQKEEHHGGNRWIGTGGTSPFGHSGANPAGIRIGGPGGGRSAVKVAEERRFQNYRHDRTLDTRQLKVALKSLRKLNRIGVPEELDIEKTIQATCKNAGDIDLVFSPPHQNQSELLLVMDVGGSMDVYSSLVESLFSAAHASQHFKEFKHFYFHNCVYSKIYQNMELGEVLPTVELFHKFRKSFYLIFVGDACMNPYELFSPNGSIDYWSNEKEPGIEWLKKMRDYFPASIWLNPEPSTYWNQHPTIHAVSQIFPMFPLTLEGLAEGIETLKSR